MDYVNRNIIVPEEHADTFRAIVALATSAATADGMWRTKLSTSGQVPATYAISAGPCGPEFAALLPLTSYYLDSQGTEQSLTVEGDTAGLCAMAAAWFTPEQVQQLLQTVIVTDEDPWTTLARVNLKVITEDTV